MIRKICLMVAVMVAILVVMVPGAGYAAPARIGSITDKVDGPVRVALDSQGNVYVSENSGSGGVVKIYSRKGKYLNSISKGLEPLGVAVDGAGSIYVGSQVRKAVDIYAPDMSFVRSIGVGTITLPNSIAVDGAATVYVVDTNSNVVRVYDSAGKAMPVIGGSGSTDGLFNKPMAVAVSDSTGEIYVADLRTVTSGGSLINGSSIQVFDKTTGVFKRSFGFYGASDGQIGKPYSLALDKSGNLYVLDFLANKVQILNAATGAFVGSINDPVKDSSKPFNTPLGVAVSKNDIAYVTSNTGKNLDSFCVDACPTMDLSPASVTVAGQQLGANPAAQSIVISNGGSGALAWTAASNASWISLNAAAGSVAPASSSSDLAVSVDISNLSVGTHQGSVTVRADYGQADIIPITVTVLSPPVLSLSNGWLNFAVKKSVNQSTQSVTVGIDNASSLAWSASSAASWLSIVPASGTATTPSSITANTSNLAPGSYTGVITFSAPGAVGDGSTVTVNLSVTQNSKITVMTNVAGSQFTLAGPAATYTGGGLVWSIEDAVAGDYTISFDAVSGYRKPMSQAKTLLADGELVVSANYLSLSEIAARRTIVVAKGPAGVNDSRVKTYKADGTAASLDIMAFDAGSKFGANVASADVDGDGVAELIVGSGPGKENVSVVRIFKADGTKLAEFTPFTANGGVNVSSADFNGDGTAEIVVAPAFADNIVASVKVFAYAKNTNEVVPTGVDIRSLKYRVPVLVATSDSASPAAPKLYTLSLASAHTVALNIWTIDASRGDGSWKATADKTITLPRTSSMTSLAAADVNADGVDEIIIGLCNGKKSKSSSKVAIYNTDGVEVGNFAPFDGFRFALSVAAADMDGDGIAELIVGTGNDGDPNPRKTKKSSLVGIFNAAGEVRNTIIPYTGSKNGVVVAVGEMGL